MYHYMYTYSQLLHSHRLQHYQMLQLMFLHFQPVHLYHLNIVLLSEQMCIRDRKSTDNNDFVTVSIVNRQAVIKINAMSDSATSMTNTDRELIQSIINLGNDRCV